MREKKSNADREVGAFLEMLGDLKEEVRTQDLERFVQEELKKDAEVMDTQALAEALELLHGPDEARKQADKEAVWQAIERDLPRREADKPRHGRVARKMGLAAALLSVLLVTSFGCAYAFNWQFLLKLFEPIASTFGFVTNQEPQEFPPPDERIPEGEVEGISIEPIVSDRIENFEDVPCTLDGYPVIFPWIPEGYEFDNAIYMTDEMMKDICFTYVNGEDELHIECIVYANDDIVSSVVFEKNPGGGWEDKIQGVKVAVSRNTISTSAIWNDSLAYYNIWGDAEEKDIVKMINRMYGGE